MLKKLTLLLALCTLVSNCSAQAGIQIVEYGKNARHPKNPYAYAHRSSKRIRSSAHRSPYRTAIGGDYLSQLDGNGSRWNHPILVYVQPAAKAAWRSLVASCFNEWQSAAKGAFSWNMVSSPQQANYVIGWTTSRRELSTGTEAGVTTTDTTVADYSGREAIERARTNILTRLNGRYLSDSALRGTILHEIGHGLGLMGHSSHPSDIMYYAATGQKPYLNTRDSNTIRHLYSI